MKRVIPTVIGTLAVQAAAVIAFIYSGIYDISATHPHTAPVQWALQKTMERSVEVRADHVEVPDLAAFDWADSGLRLYRAHCLQCHGAPGVSRAPFSMGLTPVATNLVQAARERTAAEIYWAVKYGIKMSGMPAWQFRMTEEELWQTVAFVHRLPFISAVEYAEMVAAQDGAFQQSSGRHAEE